MFGGSKGGTGGNVIFWDFDSSAKLLSKLQKYSTFRQPISSSLYNCLINKSFVLSISCHDGVNLFLTELYGDSGGLSPYWPAAYFCPYNLLESTQSQEWLNGPQVCFVCEPPQEIAGRVILYHRLTLCYIVTHAKE